MYYYIKNILGDITKIIAQDGTIVANYVYDYWGKILSITDSTGATISDTSHIAHLNPFRYRGYVFDDETGLYYLQSRYYDPVIGRFLNADVYCDTGTGTPLSTNMFAYCENNTVNYIDPCGDTCYYFYGKDQEKAANINCKILSKKYNVVKKKITSKKSFTDEWGKIGRVRGGRGSQKKIDIVIINLHGSPTSVGYININDLQKKNIDTLLLLSCNAGHQDYKYSNPAYKLFNKNTIRQLVSCDGTHYRKLNLFKTKVTHEVKGDATYKQYLKNSNRKSKGFVVYKTVNKKTSVTSLGSKFNSIDKLLSKIGKW